MQNQVYFENIREEIVTRLKEAKSSIRVAVAWLTDPVLFGTLVAQQRKRISVTVAVLDDRINRTSSIAWEQLTAAGGTLCWIPEGTNRSGSLHHKFCLIDGRTVINGSFNWTRRASSADENIIVMTDDDIAQEFLTAFERLLGKHGHDTVVVIDTERLIKRLVLLEQLLSLGDYEDVLAQSERLRFAESLPEVALLVQLLHDERWAESTVQIRLILSRATALTKYRDPYLDELCLQISVLENQQAALQAELADMQKEIMRFDYQQEEAIGDTVRRYLELNWKVYANRAQRAAAQEDWGSAEAFQEDAQEAEQTFHDYEKAQAEHAEQAAPIQLSSEDADQLKKLFRKLSMLCHPDRVEEDKKVLATQLFQQLNTLNDSNDLAGMEAFALQIKNGLSEALIVNSLQRQEQLELRVQELLNSLRDLAYQIAQLEKTETWQTLSGHEDWDVWFAHIKRELDEQIEALSRELEELQVEG